MMLSGWGRFPKLDCAVSDPRDDAQLRACLQKAPAIARGNGRSYGDSAMNAAHTIDMRRFNRMLAFDETRGVLTLEAGVLLADVIDVFLPRGWFPSVTPGTKHVTIGGMIAADVHGKNHHKDGSFGPFIEWIDVLVADDDLRRCSRTQNADLFAWTIGGMGLTGIILRAAIRLKPVRSGWIRQTRVVAQNLAQCLSAMQETQSATYSVAWIDCLSRGAAMGRSILMLGEHAEPDELPEANRARPFDHVARRPWNIPFDAPAFAMNKLSISLFNALYFWRGSRGSPSRLIDWDSYFYPLDAIKGWNRIYGRRGFVQFQCVLPEDQAALGLHKIITSIAQSGHGSFLAVLKRFGAAGDGISFAMPGYTLALDFPVTRDTFTLLDELDEITLAHGGRFYLAKDSRMSAATCNRSDTRLTTFRHFRDQQGLAPRFQSAQSKRLAL